LTSDDLLAFLDSDENLNDKFDHKVIKFKDIKPWKAAASDKKVEIV